MREVVLEEVTFQLQPERWAWGTKQVREARTGQTIAGRANCTCRVCLPTSPLYVWHRLVALPFSFPTSQPIPHTNTHTHVTYAHFLIFPVGKFLFTIQYCSNVPSPMRSSYLLWRVQQQALLRRPHARLPKLWNHRRDVLGKSLSRIQLWALLLPFSPSPPWDSKRPRSGEGSLQQTEPFGSDSWVGNPSRKASRSPSRSP